MEPEPCPAGEFPVGDAGKSGDGAGDDGLAKIASAVRLFEFFGPAADGTVGRAVMEEGLRRQYGHAGVRCGSGDRVDFLSYWQATDGLLAEDIASSHLDMDDVVLGMQRLRDGVLTISGAAIGDAVPSGDFHHLLREIRVSSRDATYWDEVIAALPQGDGVGLTLMEVAEAVYTLLRDYLRNDADQSSVADAGDCEFPETATLYCPEDAPPVSAAMAESTVSSMPPRGASKDVCLAKDTPEESDGVREKAREGCSGSTADCDPHGSATAQVSDVLPASSGVLEISPMPPRRSPAGSCARVIEQSGLPVCCAKEESEERLANDFSQAQALLSCLKISISKTDVGAQEAFGKLEELHESIGQAFESRACKIVPSPKPPLSLAVEDSETIQPLLQILAQRDTLIADLRHQLGNMDGIEAKEAEDVSGLVIGDDICLANGTSIDAAGQGRNAELLEEQLELQRSHIQRLQVVRDDLLATRSDFLPGAAGADAEGAGGASRSPRVLAADRRCEFLQAQLRILFRHTQELETTLVQGSHSQASRRRASLQRLQEESASVFAELAERLHTLEVQKADVDREVRKIQRQAAEDAEQLHALRRQRDELLLQTEVLREQALRRSEVKMARVQVCAASSKGSVDSASEGSSTRGSGPPQAPVCSSALAGGFLFSGASTAGASDLLMASPKAAHALGRGERHDTIPGVPEGEARSDRRRSTRHVARARSEEVVRRPSRRDGEPTRRPRQQRMRGDANCDMQ